MARRTGPLNIITDNWMRDPRLERRMIEQKREEVIWGLVIAGSVLVLLAILW